MTGLVARSDVDEDDECCMLDRVTEVTVTEDGRDGAFVKILRFASAAYLCYAHGTPIPHRDCFRVATSISASSQGRTLLADIACAGGRIADLAELQSETWKRR